VDSSPEVEERQEMALLAVVWALGKSALRAVWDAVVAATAPSPMLVVAKESTSRRRPTSTLVMGEILM